LNLHEDGYINVIVEIFLQQSVQHYSCADERLSSTSDCVVFT